MHQAIQLLAVQPQPIRQLLPCSLKEHQSRLRNPTGDGGFVRLIRAPHLTQAQSVDEMKAKNVTLLRREHRNRFPKCLGKILAVAILQVLELEIVDLRRQFQKLIVAGEGLFTIVGSAQVKRSSQRYRSQPMGEGTKTRILRNLGKPSLC